MTIFQHITASSLFALAAIAAFAMPGEARAASVKIDAELGQSVLPAKKSQTVYLRLNLKSLATAAKEARRAPVNVALVLDRSGSMQGARIAAAKEAARMALARLNGDDTLALVAFNHNVDVLQKATRLDDAPGLKDKIDALRADGTTAIYAGVMEGGAQVKKYLDPKRVNRVILMSDGLANVGPSSPAELAKLGKELASQGISVTTIGLGLDYNEDLMQRLAAASDGNHAFAKNPEDLVRFFNAEFGDALSVAAQDIEIIIEIKAQFKPKRVLSREADIAGQKIKLKLNSLQSDNERYVVVELETSDALPEGPVDVASVDVDYLDIDTGQRSKAAASVNARASASQAEVDASVNATVAAQAAVQIATEESKRAIELRDKGDIAGARRVLDSNAALLGRSKAATAAMPSAPARTLSDLDELEAKNKAAADNLSAEKWEAQRKAMRYDQQKYGTQQKY